MAPRGTVPLRTLVAVAMLGLVPGCARTPAEDAAPPAAGPATAAPAVAPDARARPVAYVENFSSDDVRLGTEVGERTLGQGLSTTGKTGWLMFGPYVALPAGRYEVALQGLALEGHAGVVHLDVAQGKGSEVLAAAELDAPVLQSPPSPDGLAVLAFTLARPSSDLEVRVRVTEASNLSLSGFVIRALP